MSTKKEKIESKAEEDKIQDLGTKGSVDARVSEVKDESLELGDIPKLNEEDESTDDTEVEDNSEAEGSEELDLELEPSAKTETPKAIVRPSVNAGICEHCGVPVNGGWVYDPKNTKGWRAAKPSDPKDKVVSCKHYSKVEMVCGYCRNPEMTKERTLRVYSLPERPNVLITCCDDYKCTEKHQKRFGDNSVQTASRTAN